MPDHSAQDGGSTLRAIRRQQVEWAESRQLEVDSRGYLARPEDNLPWLTRKTREEFDAADGGEFSPRAGRAKIAALHSSSALAVNFFDYWRPRDSQPLAAALGIAGTISEIRFEQKFPTRVGSRAPNIDVVIRTASEQLYALESKFCEPYSPKPQPLQDKYFPPGEGRWASAGLPGVQLAAEELRRNRRFEFVDAAQLLKHILGLAQTQADWHLVLLWYVPPGAPAEAMVAEAAEFQRLLGTDAARFSWMSYQELWRRLVPHLGVGAQEYSDYLSRRYLPETVSTPTTNSHAP
jgi:hypothetical protein